MANDDTASELLSIHSWVPWTYWAQKYGFEAGYAAGIEAGERREREACAAVADGFAEDLAVSVVIGDAIRARGK